MKSQQTYIHIHVHVHSSVWIIQPSHCVDVLIFNIVTFTAQNQKAGEVRNIPEHDVPVPLYPVLQAQEKEPAVLVHVASA